MSALDGQPESSAAARGDSPLPVPPTPIAQSTRSKGKKKPKAHISESQGEIAALTALVQSLANQVGNLTGQISTLTQEPSIRLGSSIASDRSGSTQGLPETVLPSTEPNLFPQRIVSEVRTDYSSNPRPYKTRDIQTLSDGVEYRYRSWVIQLKAKFLEPYFAGNSEQVRMNYLFSATSGLAQSYLEPRMDPESVNPFCSVAEMLEVLNSGFVNPNQQRQAQLEYRDLMMSSTEVFINFKSRFNKLAEEAGIPMVTRHMDLYDKLTIELQTVLVPVLDTLPTYELLAARVTAIDQEQKWISQRAAKAKAARLIYGRPPAITTTTRPVAIHYKSGDHFPPSTKSLSVPPAPRVHSSDQKPRSPTPASDLKCYNCDQHGHYASACPNPRKASADLKEFEQMVPEDSLVEDPEEQGKDEP